MKGNSDVHLGMWYCRFCGLDPLHSSRGGLAESKGIFVGLVGRLCVEFCIGLPGASSGIISPVGISGTGVCSSTAPCSGSGSEPLRSLVMAPFVVLLFVPLLFPLGKPLSSLLYLSSVRLGGGPGTVRLRNHSWPELRLARRCSTSSLARALARSLTTRSSKYSWTAFSILTKVRLTPPFTMHSSSFIFLRSFSTLKR